MADEIDKLVTRWVRSDVRQLSAYHVPDASGLVKLDAMENPYGWPEAMVTEWLAILRKVSLNRYPDPAARELTARLQEAMQIPRDMAVILGNGSDEIIQIICMALAQPGRLVLAPEPTFVMYRMIALFTGMQFHGVPLTADFALDRAAMLDAIEQYQPAVIFLAYPNNPTGNLFDENDVVAIIEAAPGLVVLDEAYTVFARESFMQRLGQWPNLVVMRTVSKQGLAGLRLGLLAGPPAWLEEFNKVRLPYNINVLTQASAEFALRHSEVLDEQADKIRTERSRVLQALSELPGITAYPSAANFIMFRTAAGKASRLFEQLKDSGVLIKNLDSKGPLQDCLRVTVSTPAENDMFLQQLVKLLA
jgi:histidinol-phosphate aminotransferase